MLKKKISEAEEKANREIADAKASTAQCIAEANTAKAAAEAEAAKNLADAKAADDRYVKAKIETDEHEAKIDSLTTELVEAKAPGVGRTTILFAVYAAVVTAGALGCSVWFLASKSCDRSSCRKRS